MPSARAARRFAEPRSSVEVIGEHSEFRLDLERIRFSPYFSRLSAVTQVIAQPGAGPLIHNRLTHSIKVTAVARAIAVGMHDPASPAHELALEHGCDAVVVQAAASAHDLGHPPFGHLGERVLDRLARESLGLADGFEGNAQTYRIITALDVCEAAPQGLNLTAAVRTAVAKYPWTRFVDVGTSDGPLPRGLRRRDGGVEVVKFSAYDLDADDLEAARSGMPPLQQSLECSIMDIADDIAYSIHDVDDFYRAGLLSQGAVAREFRGWIAGAAELRALDEEALSARNAPPGSALEGLREAGVRRLVVLPLYPQYSATTTAAALDRVQAALARWPAPPELLVIEDYHDDPCHIAAVAASISATRAPFDHLLFSFHGIPARYAAAGDRYGERCRTTARLVAERLGLPEKRWSVAFQSRVGRARWLEPYTEDRLRELAVTDGGRLAVVCPGFAVDCLETLEEIAIRGSTTYLTAGGADFEYVPALNDDAEQVDCLARRVAARLGAAA